MRLSYLIWQEEVVPLIAVELLSPRTQNEDLGRILRDTQGKPTQGEMYESFPQVPCFVTFDRPPTAGEYSSIREGGTMKSLTIKAACGWKRSNWDWGGGAEAIWAETGPGCADTTATATGC